MYWLKSGQTRTNWLKLNKIPSVCQAIFYRGGEEVGLSGIKKMRDRLLILPKWVGRKTQRFLNPVLMLGKFVNFFYLFFHFGISDSIVSRKTT